MKRAALLVAVIAAMALFPMWAVRSARADTASPAVTEEAWYTPSPTCALPSGCGPVSPTPSPVDRYPAHTLHVGVTGGVEDARTYLKFDPALPDGATPTNSTLTMPIAPSGDGSVQPATATVLACLATAPFTPGEGTIAAPPAVDCNTSSPAEYAAGPPSALTVDLAPFLARWKDTPNNGIALLPSPRTAPGTTWHVAFSAHDRAGSDVPPASIDLRYDPASAAPPPAATEPETEPVPDLVTGGSGVGGFLGASLATPPPASAAAPLVGESKLPGAVRRPRLVGQVGGPGFAYPVVFAAPLLLLVLGGYFGWALTQPVELFDSTRTVTS
jgi:hypothetical protein